MTTTAETTTAEVVDDLPDATETPDETTEVAETPDPAETADAEVEQLRERAQHADTLAERLHTELVRATGRLADPTDLPFDAAHLDDPEALAAAIDELLERKPHLATRRPAGDIGQGQRGPAPAPFSLLETLKQRT